MQSKPSNERTGVLLMTYGSATTEDGVADYLAHIYTGEVPSERVEEFKRRYRLIGSSPLVAITKAQADALQEHLGDAYVVRSAMRHSDPFIQDVVRDMRAAGAARIVGIILAPQFSSLIMEGYRTALFTAAAQEGYTPEEVSIVEAWPTQPHFIEYLASSIEASCAELHVRYGTDVPIIFTTHSLPQRVVEQDPDYLDQIRATQDGVLAQLSTRPEWYAAYQSAGHSPEAWLTPDLSDVLKTLKNEGKSTALIVPIQFLADHLEVLYDLDIAAREQSEAMGMPYHRIALPNTDPRFMTALATLAKAV